jgi:hypothetical protein
MKFLMQLIRSGEGFNKAVCQVALNLEFAFLSGEWLKCEKKIDFFAFFNFYNYPAKKACNKKAQLRP